MYAIIREIICVDDLKIFHVLTRYIKGGLILRPLFDIRCGALAAVSLTCNITHE